MKLIEIKYVNDGGCIVLMVYSFYNKDGIEIAIAIIIK
jgi:hypothetical protein